MAKSLHLHVGPHKTGSTYLQKQLFTGREQLSDAGWLYPDTGISAFGHHDVVNLYRKWILPHSQKLTSELQELSFRDDRNILLSSENFVFLNREQLARLRDGFPRHTVSVSYFYRSAAEIWPSHWQELIKHGEWLPFGDYLATVMGVLNRFDATVVDPLAQLTKFADVFGRENLTVFPYNAIRDGGGDLVPVFLAEGLGLGPILPSGNEAVNSSLAPETVEMIRQLNERYFMAHGTLPGTRLRQRYLLDQGLFEGDTFTPFREAFATHAQAFDLSPDNAIQRAREEILLTTFADRIVGHPRLHGEKRSAKRVLAVPRHWAAAAGCSQIVAAIYEALQSEEAPPPDPESRPRRNAAAEVSAEEDQVGLAAEHLAASTVAHRYRPMLEDPSVVARILEDPVPLPAPRQRNNAYSGDHLGYWLSGLADLRALQRLIGPGLFGPVLDFGSSSGRVARHWAAEPEAYDVAACDLGEHMVVWMQHHLAGRVRAYRTKPMPPVPFADDSFGLIYAFSVFTQIDNDTAWLDEFARLIAPGGRVAITVHNDDTWAAIPTLKWKIREDLEENPEFMALREEHPAPPGRVCFETERVRYVFYSNAHIREVWGARFEILAILPDFHNYQTMVLMAPL